MEPIATLIIPEYITHVKLSNKRRAKYYKRGENKIPQKYLPYPQFDKEGYLLDKEGKRVLKNPRSAGKPRIASIRGNDFTSGFASEHIRLKITTALKDFYRPFVHDQLSPFPEEAFPLRIEWDVYRRVDPADYDLSNLWFYWKYLEDCLFETFYRNKEIPPIIPDDNIRYITHPPSPRLFPVDTDEERRFVFRFYSDHRKELLSHPLWKPVLETV